MLRRGIVRPVPGVAADRDRTALRPLMHRSRRWCEGPSGRSCS